MATALNIDTTNKLAVNGVDLTNREELSPSQNRELQRFIDANAHLLSFKDRELPPEPMPKQHTPSNYSSMSRRLGGVNPADEYRTIDTHFDNNRMTNRQSSRSVSPEKKTPSSYYRAESESPYIAHTFPRSNDEYMYGSIGGGSNLRNQFSSPNADSLKRKGVSWSDLVGGEGGTGGRGGTGRGGGRQAWPDQHYDRHRMAQFESSGSLNREYNMSPAYSTMSKGRDNYNRFETDAHAAARAAQMKREDDASKFSGYGDRPGSGVELTKHTWAGGQIIEDPNQLPRGPKPRRMYYSPIGDGVVAADGVELKRKPVDLNPRVTVTQLTHVERGQKGHDGLNEYIKSWSTGASAPASEYGGDFSHGPGGPGSGHGHGAVSPDRGGLGDLGGHGGPANGTGAGGPRGPAGAGGDPFAGLGGRGNTGSPFDTNRSGPGGDHNGPDTGRMSTASSMFSDPGYKYTDIKHGYAITNPRELIHQYATTTPVAVMDVSDNTPGTMTTATYKKKVTTRIEERQGGNVQGDTYAPYPPYKASTQTVSESRTLSPNNFVRKLRDDTMTHSQREANTHMDALNQRDPNAQQRVQDIKQKTGSSGRSNDEIDSLTSKMMEGFRSAPTPSRY